MTTEERDFSTQLKHIEQKWQSKWEDKELFQSEPSDEEKFYITVAYPYPSGGMHIGHIRTYMLPDVFARYHRMKGKNVLFPMGWHVTGTPIIGALNRIKEGDQDQIDTLRNTYNVPEEVLNGFDEPMDFARYFIDNSYRPSFKQLGFSVDWRREFTTNDDKYNRFIEWQYKRLKEQGRVNKGLHPTKYCLKDENPVTTHDLLEGEDAERLDYTVIKFDTGDLVLPAATLRPETVFGVTHLLVDPDITYQLVEIDGETWTLTEEVRTKFEKQNKSVIVVDDMSGSELLGETATNPITGDEIPVLPATFIDPDAGTGVVMSVPGHAPYDWISLRDLQEDPDALSKYDINPVVVRDIEPVQIIESGEYTDIPAKEACERYDVTSQNDEAKLESATDEVYTAEFNEGVLLDNCGEFAGKEISEVKEDLRDTFSDRGVFDQLYDFNEPVVSRSGGKVIVSLQESWFINYDQESWKDLVKQNLDEMDIIPNEKRPEFYDTVDWLEQWPCIRNYGLGTRLPFDSDFVVEPLSDSTVYMAFYTISHIISDVDPDALEPMFFDYIFNGQKSAETVAEETGIPIKTIEQARESFSYWYPLDWRTTAYELIRNHLTFMQFHHTALFDEENWVNGIATWGMGLLEGQKMSSSKGHVIVAEDAIERHSADIIRMHLFASNEPWQDFDWRPDEVRERETQLRQFKDRVTTHYGTGADRDHGIADRYVLSRLQSVIAETTAALDDFQTRKAILAAFFELNNLFNTYYKTVDKCAQDVVDSLLETQIKLMSPFIPHLCEELGEEIGREEYVSTATWPSVDESMVDRDAERKFEFVEETVEDIRAVIDLVDEYERLTIVLAADWKRDLFQDLADLIENRVEFGEAMSQLTDGRSEHGQKINEYLQKYNANPKELPETMLSRDEERKAIEALRGYIKSEFNVEVNVVDESDTTHERAERAEPSHPAIILN